MITNVRKFRQFEKRLIASTKPDFRRNLALVEMLRKESRKILAGRPIDPLDGIEVDIRIARVINSV